MKRSAVVFLSVILCRLAFADCPATWSEKPVTGPSPRWIPGLAFDAARGRVVLFGGSYQTPGGESHTFHADTWLWDGVRWTASTGGSAPEGRESASMVYDEGRARIVLFGGKNTELITGNNYFPDTWELDGSGWTRRAIPGPPGRGSAAMAYDARRGRVVLYGGDRDHQDLSDTWEYDGTSWTRRDATGPGVRGATMAYDRNRGRVVLFGGADADDVTAGTWEWDGQTWTPRAVTGPRPQGRYEGRLVWDGSRQALVLFGGAGSERDAEPTVWELSDDGWRPAESAGPGARNGHGMAWDAVRSKLVVFGGVKWNGTTATFVSDTWERTASATAERLLPVVVDAVGSGGARFTTEVSLTNRGAAPADVSLRYTASLGSGSGTVADRLAAGEQRVIPDVVAYLRQKGLSIPAATGGGQAGTLGVRFDCLDVARAVAVTARTTSPTASPLPVGSAGLAYSGEAPVEGPSPSTLAVFGLRSNGTDRSNVAVLNTTAVPVTLRVTAVSGSPGDGRRVSVADALTLGPHEWRQYSFGDVTGLTNGHVLVEKVAGDGAFSAYGVVNDNVTNDGSFLAAVPPAPLPSGVAQLPVLVETPRFQSELVLSNAGAVPANVELTYVESLAPTSAAGTVRVTLAPHEQRLIPGAIDFLRRNGVPLGELLAANRAGSVRMTLDPPTAPVFAGARTAAPSGGGGQFGLFTPAGAPTAQDEAFLCGLRADADNRSNVAVVNSGGPGSGSVTLTLQAHDGNAGGAASGSPRTVTLQPGQWMQEDGFLGSAGVANGWVRVTRVSGTAPWLAYAVVNDGGTPGARTGDGAYVPMTRIGR